MNSHPTAAELVDAVARWLSVGDDGARGFESRVARSALDIVARELRLAPEAERRGVARLEVLTGVTGSFADLEQRLCVMIRDGDIAPDDAALMAHLCATTRDRLTIDQPLYPHELGENG